MHSWENLSENKEWRIKIQTEILKTADDSRNFTPWIEFWGINEANKGNKMKIMCFQTFSTPWIQVSTVSNIFHEKKMFWNELILEPD